MRHRKRNVYQKDQENKIVQSMEVSKHISLQQGASDFSEWQNDTPNEKNFYSHMHSQSITEWLKLAGNLGHHLVQPSCWEQGQLGQIFQDCDPSDFEALQGQRLYKLSGQCGPLFDHSLIKIIACVLVEFPVFGLVPIACHPIAGHHWEEPGSIFFTFPHEVFACTRIGAPWASLLHAEHSQLSQPLLTGQMLQACSSSSWPFGGLGPACLCASLSGELSTGPSPAAASPELSRGSPPSICWEHSA